MFFDFLIWEQQSSVPFLDKFLSEECANFCVTFHRSCWLVSDIFSDRNEGGVDDVRLDATDREGAMSIIQYYDSSSTKASQNNSILTRAELLRHYDLIKQLTQVKINFHEKSALFYCSKPKSRTVLRKNR